MSDPVYNDLGYFEHGLRGAGHEHRLRDQPAGAYQILGALPPGILVAENVLQPALCKQLVDYARDQPFTRATVQKQGVSNARDVTPTHERVTDYIAPGQWHDRLTGLMRDIFCGIVHRHYGERIIWFEQPEILRYGPGGHYKPHADSENWNREARRWESNIDRHFSLLLYLNDDFSGGQLDFLNFGLRLQPKPGMLVVFPSDHRYVHAARPTQSGSRFVVVCWAAAAGRKRVDPGTPPGATLIGAEHDDQ